MAIKSLISQARQIKASEGYKDLNYVDGLQGAREVSGDMHTALVAEGTTYLEEDINNIRVQLQEIIGKTSWYDQTSISLEELVSTGNKTIVQPVQLAGGLTFAAGTADSTLTSGSAADETGTSLGFLFGAAATDGKHRVILRDKVTNMPIVDANENVVFGLVEAGTATDGSDLSTTTLNIVTYTDVDGTLTPYAYAGSAEVVLPQRVLFADSSEDFAMINAGFANSVGSIELGDRLWVALDPTTGNYDLVAESGNNTDLSITKDADLTTVINALIARATEAGVEAGASSDTLGLTYNLDGTIATDFETLWDGDGVSTNYLNYNAGAGTTTILDALTVLDNTLKTVEDIAKEAAGNTQVEILAADLAEATAWTIPGSVQVVTDDKDACKVFVNGQLLASDKLVSGTAGDGSGDYTVSSNTEITFNFPLIAGDVITIEVLKEFVV